MEHQAVVEFVGPWTGPLVATSVHAGHDLRPEIAAMSMSGSSFIVAVNALMLKRLKLPAPTYIICRLLVYRGFTN